ncbi:unnamed protein product [Closterium sp. NIES-54]
MAAAKRVLRYLCSTSGMGLVLGGRSPVVLTGHADASWADDQATQRSSQGYTFSLGSGSVSWRATRSSSVLSSSCEAEIYAGAMAAQELRWLTYLLTDLGEPPRSSPVLYVDNKAMLALCREQRLEHRTKHIALRYFLARELQQRGQLRLAYVASEANTADVFTKALAPCDHQRFCTQLGLVLKQAGCVVKRIRIDRGGEFLGAEMTAWLKKQGNQRELTTAYTPQSNCVAEQATRIILETDRALLIESGVGNSMWPHAVRHATVAKNRVLTKVGNDSWVPLERWLRRKPPVDMLRVFGCMAVAQVPKKYRSKLGASAIWCVHLGLAAESKGWLLWEPSKGVLFDNRDVNFVEGMMYWGSKIQPETKVSQQMEEITMQLDLTPSVWEEGEEAAWE